MIHSEDAQGAMADQQRQIIREFCINYAHENGYSVQGMDEDGNESKEDYQDVTG